MRLLYLVAMALAGPVAAGQAIEGRVFDPSGAVVAGARVMLMQDYVKLAETKSGAEGEFSFTGLKPELYHVQIKITRLALFQTHVILKPGATDRIWAVLQCASGLDHVVMPGPAAPAGVARGATRPRVRRVGALVTPPRLLKMVPAKYPAELASTGAEGPVVLESSIEADGSVGEIWALESPDPVLEEAAIAAVKQWRYEAATLNGKKVRNRLQVVVEFKLR